jgi:4-alpha-glucanotransferase
MTIEAEWHEFEAFRAGRGASLLPHARFEALHAHFFGADPRQWHWRSWPAPLRDPADRAVAEFAAAHAAEVDFHLWMQFMADRGLAAAQAAAKAAGMAIGLISDLAVGTDSGGSHCWSRQEETLGGLTIGAPPDLLNRQGQDWGVVAFSPHGLRRRGYAAFLEMLRAALSHAGGVRIDHAMGLNRLWVIPDGAGAHAGAYLTFPERDLMRLVALESHRHGAIVLAEDLGTVPEGFEERLGRAGLAGMRVLWFERDRSGAFIPPRQWTHRAAGMTSTHDLPTVAGWWSGRDIEWRERLGMCQDSGKEREERAADRARLWQSFCASGAASGDPPGPDQGARVADAAVVHVAGSACELAMVPAEDALALREQPNLPGTVDEHPNWRRRLPGPAATVLDAPEVAARLAELDRARRA